MVIHQKSDENVINTFLSLQTFSIVLINDASGLNVPIDHRRAMPLFLTTANSGSEIQERLETFKNSAWWSIKATFIILDTLDSCKNPENILERLWKAHVETGVFVCYDKDHEIMIYTYNPVKNRSLIGWTQVQRLYQPVKGWALYSLRVQTGADACRSLV